MNEVLAQESWHLENILENFYLYGTKYPRSVAINLVPLHFLYDKSLYDMCREFLHTNPTAGDINEFVTLEEGIFSDPYFDRKLLVLLKHNFKTHQNQIEIPGKYVGIAEVTYADEPDNKGYLIVVDFLNERRQKEFGRLINPEKGEPIFTGEYYPWTRERFNIMLKGQATLMHRIKEINHQNI